MRLNYNFILFFSILILSQEVSAQKDSVDSFSTVDSTEIPNYDTLNSKFRFSAWFSPEIPITYISYKKGYSADPDWAYGSEKAATSFSQGLSLAVAFDRSHKQFLNINFFERTLRMNGKETSIYSTYYASSSHTYSINDVFRMLGMRMGYDFNFYHSKRISFVTGANLEYDYCYSHFSETGFVVRTRIQMHPSPVYSIFFEPSYTFLKNYKNNNSGNESYEHGPKLGFVNFTFGLSFGPDGKMPPIEKKVQGKKTRPVIAVSPVYSMGSVNMKNGFYDWKYIGTNEVYQSAKRGQLFSFGVELKLSLPRSYRSSFVLGYYLNKLNVIYSQTIYYYTSNYNYISESRSELKKQLTSSRFCIIYDYRFLLRKRWNFSTGIGFAELVSKPDSSALGYEMNKSQSIISHLQFSYYRNRLSIWIRGSITYYGDIFFNNKLRYNLPEVQLGCSYDIFCTTSKKHD